MNRRGAMNVYDRLRKTEASPAWDRCSAYVITAEKTRGEIVGKILVAHPRDGMGPLHVFVWDWTDPENPREIQYGAARGCGYDKLSAALSGLWFGKQEFRENDWKAGLHDQGYSYFQAL